jgi:hypothetical protein
VSLETNPSPDYQNNAVAAINLMAAELDLSPPAWFRRLLGRMSQPAKLPTPWWSPHWPTGKRTTSAAGTDTESAAQ